MIQLTFPKFDKELLDAAERESIHILRQFEPEEGYYLAFSGGKDSVVLLHLAKKANVKFDAHYNITTIDPPELLQFIKTFPEIKREKPDWTMRQLILKELFLPTRKIRYCCKYLKERGGEGRITLTGIRKAESTRRSKRKVVEMCRKINKTTINPIFHWSDGQIWSYIKREKIRYCSLYDEGFKRLGCLMCPMAASSRKKELKRWPWVKKFYVKIFNRIIKQRNDRGKGCSFKTGEEFFEWWLSK